MALSGRGRRFLFAVLNGWEKPLSAAFRRSWTVRQEALTKFNGEFCMTGSRVLVQRSVADAWRDRIASLLGKVVVGRADDPNTEMGPVIDRANVARIDRFVEDAKRYANVIVRGAPIVDGPLAAGAFYGPSMLEIN
jgi:betaine-aldehyde dehydrogenase